VSSKRIAMIAYTRYTTDARPRRTAEALARRGDQVEFLALSEPGMPKRETLGGVEIRRVGDRYRGDQPLSYVASYGRFLARAAAWVAARHLKCRYDVVYIHTMPDFLAFAAGIAKLGGARVVLDVHDTMPELYQSKFGLDPHHPLIRGLATQERLSCAFADQVICVNQPHSELLVSRGVVADKLSVLLNLPDPEIFGEAATTTSPSDSRPRLVYHGTVTERLGLDVALRAVREVVGDFPDLCFDIYGSGDFAARVVQLIDSLDLAAHVNFTGEVFRVDSIPELVRGATVGMVPNRDDAATRYMLPVKLLEYVYLGVPAVVSRLPTIEHYFADDALAYFTPGDVVGLASAVKQVLGSLHLRRSLTANAARFCEAHSWEKAKHTLFAAVDGHEA
jgi:glycosyltransferase involved in cell wall biosynthesis